MERGKIMSINSEMTALADAIRAKSGVAGKLTIAGMTTAVNVIETGSVIEYGYITTDGKVQKLDLTSAEPVASGTPVEMQLHLFNTGVPEPEYSVPAPPEPEPSGGTFDLAKVAEYSPATPAITAISKVVLSGFGDDYSGANGTYDVTAETQSESDPWKRIYKHTSGNWYFWGEYDEEYEEGYWYVGVAPDSGDLVTWTSEELSSGEYYFENWDSGDSYNVSLDVTKTDYPEVPMVLKGVMATGYADGEWSFEETEQSFTGFETKPKPSFIYAVSGNNLIGNAVAVDMDVPAGTVFLFDKSLTDVIGGIPVTNYGLTASDTGIVCADGKYAEIPAGALPSDVMCDNKPWTLEIRFRCLDTAASWDKICLFGRGMLPSRFDVLASKSSITIGGMSIDISAPLNDTDWHLYKITHTSANVFTAYLDDAFSKSASSSGYNMRDYQMWIGRDGESRYASPFEIEYVRIGNTVEVG